MIEAFSGKPIDDMDRNELIEVIRYLAKDAQVYMTSDMREAVALGRVEQLKQGKDR